MLLLSLFCLKVGDLPGQQHQVLDKNVADIR